MAEVFSDLSISYAISPGGDLPFYLGIGSILRGEIYVPEILAITHKLLFEDSTPFKPELVTSTRLHSLRDEAVDAHLEMLRETGTGQYLDDDKLAPWTKSLLNDGTSVILPPEFAPAALLKANSVIDLAKSKQDAVPTAEEIDEMFGDENDVSIIMAGSIALHEINLSELQTAQVVLEGIVTVLEGRR